MTAFYMFRLWYMTFAGKPRNEHIYRHAHESPGVMILPLLILAVLAAVSAWNWPCWPWPHFGLVPLLEQARPLGTELGASAGQMWPAVAMPAESLAEAPEISHKAEWSAFFVALAGFLLSTAFYGLHKLDPEDARRTFSPLHRFLVHKWWFDELYAFLFIRPVLRVSGWVAAADKNVIDWLADSSARAIRFFSRIDDWIDRVFVDRFVDLLARWTYAIGLRLRTVQTGNIRQYVMWIAVGIVALFVLMGMY
jgi:NADH-quinone oxidoreductase subunit L